MAIDVTLAEYSNALVYGSMAVCAASFVAFAASLAAGKGRYDQAGQSARSGVVDLTEAPAEAAVASAASSGPRGSGLGDVRPPNPKMITGRSPEAPLPPGRRTGNIGLSLLWLAAALLGAGILLRGLSAGRAPWGNMYEFSITAAFAASAVFLGLSLRKDLRWLGAFIVGAVLLTLGVAVTILYTESAQLVPALDSYWLAIHVTAAIICSGGFTVAAFITALYLVRSRAERTAGDEPVTGWLASRVPPASRLDATAYRIHTFVFPLWTFAVISGAIWAEYAWGRYWGWDPKEIWAFITWVIYACYLHARATAGWRGRKAAAVALIGYATFLFNYFGINLLASGLHSYGGVS